MRVLILSLIAITGLSACAKPKPISVEQAMAQCTEKAAKSVKPNINVDVGIGVGHRVRTGVGIGIELTPDYLLGRDPHEVYETCVVAKSGEKPTKKMT